MLKYGLTSHVRESQQQYYGRIQSRWQGWRMKKREMKEKGKVKRMGKVRRKGWES